MRIDFALTLLTIIFGLLFASSAARSSADEPAPLQVQLKKVEQAVKQAAAVVAAPRNFGYVTPEVVDPTDKTERVLLLLPGGPLVIELAMTIDGQPFQTHREQMIDEVLSSVDVDKDGKATWDEALAKPSLVGGRINYSGQNEEAKKRFMAQFDQNKDGLADRFELRAMLAQYLGGPAFIVQVGGYGQLNPPVRELLDVNKDSVLQAEEIGAAEARLKSRDANDNDLLDLSELTGSPNGAYGVSQTGRVLIGQPSLVLYFLHEKADWSGLFDVLVKKYGKEGKLTAEGLPLVPDLVKRLDGDASGSIEKEELSALLVADPHLVYEANFGETGDLPVGGYVKSVAEVLKATVGLAGAPGEATSLEVPGARLQVAVSNPSPNYGNVAAYTKSLMASYDKDKNGYLDKDEMGKQPQQAQQFALWDADNDGKVYPDEITKSYERQQIPTWQRVTVGAVDQGNSLFSLLDTDNDNRLSLREMRVAPDRIKQADKNSDGQITLDEIPGTLKLTVARGNFYAGQYTQVGRGGVGGTPVAKPAGPEWFVRMDRNGDGDVTLREFLGDEEQFKKLDANADGFIDLKEAEAAK